MRRARANDNERSKHKTHQGACISGWRSEKRKRAVRSPSPQHPSGRVQGKLRARRGTRRFFVSQLHKVTDFFLLDWRLTSYVPWLSGTRPSSNILSPGGCCISVPTGATGWSACTASHRRRLAQRSELSTWSEDPTWSITHLAQPGPGLTVKL
ncbi:uncharacterized protein EKO05_0001253 [Ascochyta rabiei]|uniref:uncharacterized protein n=1 Tax=Didymella rabiei TaxID=5454 RepID=UPI0021FB6471|nr:uncharacterized protein EKO05_0001253 [Ascochyta rabiei]UPX10605.1 hypothetical protein EKO05_0001253 [Ascochyta rabiei]